MGFLGVSSGLKVHKTGSCFPYLDLGIQSRTRGPEGIFVDI